MSRRSSEELSELPPTAEEVIRWRERIQQLEASNEVLQQQVSTQQRTDRRERSPEPIYGPAPAKALKPYYIRTIGKEPAKYKGGDYQAYRNYIMDMEAQFKANEVDRACANWPGLADQKKVDYAQGFLESTPLANWRSELETNEDKEHTWKEYAAFHKSHVPRIEYLVEDTHNKYNEGKQGDQQSIVSFRDYMARLRAQLPPELRPSDQSFFQMIKSRIRPHFVRELRKQAAITDMATLVGRVLALEENEKEEAKYIKAKNKRESSPITDSKQKKPKGQDSPQRDRNRTNNRDSKGKGVEHDNEPRKRYRFTREEYNKIRKEGGCLACGKNDGHQAKDCKNPKPYLDELPSKAESSKN